MAATRDWSRTLWPASYKGFPFFFEREDEDGGLGLVVHQFPMRDDPYVEDLGEDPRWFGGTAYVTGDDADARAAAFIAVLVSHGAGTLVVPTRGPVQVKCQSFKRAAEKDKLGYIAFDVKFVRDGASFGLISTPFAGQIAYNAADRLALTLAQAFVVMVATDGKPEWVAQAASDTLIGAAATLDLIRTSSAVDPVVSAAVRDQVVALVGAAPLLLGRAEAETDDIAALAAAYPASVGALIAGADTGAAAMATAHIASVRLLAAGMSAPAAQDAMASLAGAFAFAPVPLTEFSASDAQANANAAGVTRLARLAALTAWGEAVVGRTYTDRPSGVTARAEAAERFGAELEDCFGSDYAALYLAIEALQGSVVAYLTALIADLAPVIGLEATFILPSLVYAWRLYQEPDRAVDLVLRNQVRHPSFMPREFVALAPGYAASGLQTEWPAPPL